MVRFEVASWSAIDPQFEAQVGEEVTLVGTIDSEPDVRDRTTHLYVDVGEERVLVITDPYGTYAYGDRVAVTGELLKPESFTTDLGRTFNYPGYLLARHVAYLIIYGEVAVVESGVGNPVYAWLLAGKHTFMRTIERLIPEPYVGLGEGLLLGAKRALGEERELVFRRTGIIHIVVLSGYNVMLVVTFVMYLLAYFFGIRVRALFGGIAIAVFALLVGLSATVVRASLMAVLLLVAQATGHTYAVMRALLLAGCAMLALNPYLLAFDTGFQLSFVATMGLILVAPQLEGRFAILPTTLGVRGFVTATIATQLFVLPILLYQIGEFSLVAVVVNVLVLPMVAVAMLGTFVTGVLGMVAGTLALPAALATTVMLAYIIHLAEWFAALPFAAYDVPLFPFWVVPISYLAMGALFWWLRPAAPMDASRTAASPELSGWTIVAEETVLGVPEQKRATSKGDA